MTLSEFAGLVARLLGLARLCRCRRRRRRRRGLGRCRCRRVVPLRRRGLLEDGSRDLRARALRVARATGGFIRRAGAPAGIPRLPDAPPADLVVPVAFGGFLRAAAGPDARVGGGGGRASRRRRALRRSLLDGGRRRRALLLQALNDSQRRVCPDRADSDALRGTRAGGTSRRRRRRRRRAIVFQVVHDAQRRIVDRVVRPPWRPPRLRGVRPRGAGRRSLRPGRLVFPSMRGRHGVVRGKHRDGRHHQRHRRQAQPPFESIGAAQRRRVRGVSRDALDRQGDVRTGGPHTHLVHAQRRALAPRRLFRQGAFHLRQVPLQVQENLRGGFRPAAVAACRRDGAASFEDGVGLDAVVEGDGRPDGSVSIDAFVGNIHDVVAFAIGVHCFY